MNIEEAYDQFINSPAEDSDPFWKLFKVKEQMNQAILDAVKYGFERGYAEALKQKALEKLNEKK